MEREHSTIELWVRNHEESKTFVDFMRNDGLDYFRFIETSLLWPPSFEDERAQGRKKSSFFRVCLKYSDYAGYKYVPKSCLISACLDIGETKHHRGDRLYNREELERSNWSIS